MTANNYLLKTVNRCVVDVCSFDDNGPLSDVVERLGEMQATPGRIVLFRPIGVKRDERHRFSDIGLVGVPPS